MNFGVCHSCGSAHHVVYCDGYCGRAFCERCIDAALGAGMHRLYTDTSVDLVCYSCLSERHTCWICSYSTEGRCTLGLHVCKACQSGLRVDECCYVCNLPGQLVTCYYCLRQCHEHCVPYMKRVDEYSDLTAGVCPSCYNVHSITDAAEFIGCGTGVADMHPYYGLMAQPSQFKRLTMHFKKDIFLIPLNAQYQTLICKYCGPGTNYYVLESVPDILNTLPLRIYNLDVLQWLFIAIDAIYASLSQHQYAYETVEAALKPFLKENLGKAIALLPNTIKSQFD